LYSEGDGKVKTSFGGPPPKKSYLMLDLFTKRFVMMAFFSIERVFDGLSFLWERFSLLGRWL
jgi:hypothetical protein